jgi:hypothetical protein
MQPLLRDPLIAETRGRPAGSSSSTVPNQPAKSTRRNLSRFELEQMLQPGQRTIRINQEKEAAAANPQPATRTTRRCRQTQRDSSHDDGHDSEEDRLMAVELARLQQSGGSAAPLWSTIPEFQGITRATTAYSLRPQNNQGRASS